MAFDPNIYKGENESDKEWQYKKLFIEEYHDKFDEDRLLCLAQCYANIETLGCRYPNELMKELKELTKIFEPKLKEFFDNEKMKQLDKKFSDTKIDSNKNRNNYNNYNNNNNSHNNSVFNAKSQPKIQFNNFKSSSAATNDFNTNKITSNPIKILTRIPPLNVPLPPTPINELFQQQKQQQTRPQQSTIQTFSNIQPSVLSSTASNNQETTPQKKSRNKLLEFISPKQQTSSSPSSSTSIGNPPNIQQVQADPNVNLMKILAIEKLRSRLRDPNIPHDMDIVDLLTAMCTQCNISIEYQQQLLEDTSYYGELFIETFKISYGMHKKKKRCKLDAYNYAFRKLVSDTRLGLKQVIRSGLIQYELDFGDNTYHDYHKYNNKQQQHQQQTVSTSYNQTNYNYNGFNNPKQTVPLQSPLDKLQQIPPIPLNQLTSNNNKQMLKDALQEFIIFIPSNLIIDNDKFITETNSIAILTNSCVKFQHPLQLNVVENSNDEAENAKSETIDNGKCKCTCTINGLLVATGFGRTKQEAKRQAALEALNILKEEFPIIQQTINNDDDNNRFEKINHESVIKITKMDLINCVYPEIDEESNEMNTKFVDKMTIWSRNFLLGMGWKGDGFGLGRNCQGTPTPVVHEVKMYGSKRGIGSTIQRFNRLDDYSEYETGNVDFTKLSRKAFILDSLRIFLRTYFHAKTDSDIVFESKFSNEERRILHQEAHNLNLKTQSVGTGESRFLTLTKKRSPNDILDSINSGSKGVNRKYKILNNN